MSYPQTRQFSMAMPDYVSEALLTLESAGYEAWCVGGCVRDAYLGRETHDYDIASNATWQQAERALQSNGYAVHRTGTKHGTITAIIDEHAIEVTSYRCDGVYGDGRHPDSVTFVKTIEEDLARRDFTINALAFNAARGLLDCHDGLSDLEAGIIRTVGSPEQRFSEDGLRIMRACRFASQLGFALDDETLAAMNSHKMMLANISSERITRELEGLLLGEHVHDALMATVDVLGAVMPEIVACKGFDQHSPYHIYDIWEHTAWVVQHAPKIRAVRWAALFHDIGKPGACFFEGQRAHFYGHAKLSAILAQDIMRRLAFSSRFTEQVVQLVRMHDDQIAATPRSVRKALARMDGDIEQFQALIHLKRADALAHSQLGAERVKLADDLQDILADEMAELSPFTVKQLAINGNDVMELGVAPGPAIGNALDAALDAVIDERVPNERQSLIAYLDNHLQMITQTCKYAR